MEKILIVGASGLLGSRMMELYARDYDVFGTYKTHPAKTKNVFALDANDKSGARRLMKDIGPDVVIDTHALTSMDYCEGHQKEAWRINVEGTKNLAECAKEAGSRFVLISTTDVFDGKKRTPYVETDKTNPINYYGATKLAAEEAVLSVSSDSIIARSASLFGKGLRDSSFTNWLMEDLKNNRPVSVVTDQDTNITYTDNLADFVIKLYENGAADIFHTAGRDIINRFDFANKLANEFGFNKDLITPTTTAELNFRAKRVLWVGLDVSKAERVSGVKGLGIDEAIRAFKAALTG